MRLKILRHFRTRQGGDTIVEVMIAMVILAVVIGAAYATSTRSFQTGLNASYRDQALSYAGQQVELLKKIDSSGGIKTFTDDPTVPFCVNPADLSRKPATAPGCSTPIGAPADVLPDRYSVTVIYTGDSATQTKTFNVTVNWTSANNTPNQTKLYFRTNNSWTNTSGACSGAASATAPCDPLPTGTPPPPAGLVFNTANGTDSISIPYNGTTSFTWVGVAIVSGANPCTATGAWMGSRPASATNYSVGPLTTAGDNVFTLSCPGINGSSTATKKVTVTVPSPPPPTVTTGSATSVTSNSATLNGTLNGNGSATTYQFKYGTTTGYGSTTSSTASGTGSANASTVISGLSVSTLYHFQLCATNANGTLCGSDATFTTTAVPVPVNLSAGGGGGGGGGDWNSCTGPSGGAGGTGDFIGGYGGGGFGCNGQDIENGGGGGSSAGPGGGGGGGGGPNDGHAGLAPFGGGNGGAGGYIGSFGCVGQSGFVPGGGGGGGGASGRTNSCGGSSGASGQVILACSSGCPASPYSGSATFTIPAGVTSMTIQLWGGGGGGGGSSCKPINPGEWCDTGAGGGGGGYTSATVMVVPGGVLTITVGAGGSYSSGGNTTVRSSW